MDCRGRSQGEVRGGYGGWGRGTRASEYDRGEGGGRGKRLMPMCWPDLNSRIALILCALNVSIVMESTGAEQRQCLFVLTSLARFFSLSSHAAPPPLSELQSLGMALPRSPPLHAVGKYLMLPATCAPQNFRKEAKHGAG